jgi:hypothetical protein
MSKKADPEKDIVKAPTRTGFARGSKIKFELRVSF